MAGALSRVCWLNLLLTSLHRRVSCTLCSPDPPAPLFGVSQMVGRCIVFPMMPWKEWWDLLVLFGILYSALLVPFRICFDRRPPRPSQPRPYPPFPTRSTTHIPTPAFTPAFIPVPSHKPHLLLLLYVAQRGRVLAAARPKGRCGTSRWG